MWNSLFGLISSYMVNSLWAVAAIGAAGWLAGLLLKRLGPRAQHVAWVATLALAVVTPALPLARSVFVAPSVSGAVPDMTAAISSTTQTGDLVTSGSFALPQALILAFSLFYLAVLLYFAIRFAWSLYSTAALLEGAAPAHLEEEGRELWLRCTRTFSLRNAAMLISERAAGPVTIGFRRPVLLAPGAIY